MVWSTARARQRRRHRRALRRESPAVAQRRGLAGSATGRAGRREVPLPLDLPARDLAARSATRSTSAASTCTTRRNGGQTWQVISPDLTRNDKTAAGQSRAASRPTTSASSTPASCSRSPSRRVAEGADLGGHQRRPGAPHAGRRQDLDQRHQEPSRTAAVGHDQQHRALALRRRHRLRHGRRPPGQQPRSRSSTRPPTTARPGSRSAAGSRRACCSYAHVIREDPVRRGLLYLGTENALYVSFNDGESWQPLQNNLPHAPVHGSRCRSTSTIWWSPPTGAASGFSTTSRRCSSSMTAVRDATAHLFTPRAAYRFRAAPSAADVHGPRRRSAVDVGENPPYGASINYYLGNVPSGDGVDRRLRCRRATRAHADGNEGSRHQPHLVGPEIRIVSRAASGRHRSGGPTLAWGRMGRDRCLAAGRSRPSCRREPTW